MIQAANTSRTGSLKRVDWCSRQVCCLTTTCDSRGTARPYPDEPVRSVGARGDITIVCLPQLAQVDSFI